jgi:uncharacterized protein
MFASMKRMLTLLEVLVILAASLAAAALVARSPLGQGARTLLGRPYLEYLALALIPAIAIFLQRHSFSAFGLQRDRLREQFEASFRCLVPYAFGKALLFPLGARQIIHSLVEPIVVIAVIVACSRTFRAPPATAAAALLLALPFTPHLSVAPLVFYPLFLAPAEELLFRGYMQSRLNLVLGRPFQLLGASFGWSLLIVAVLFSLFHVINLPALSHGRLDFRWNLAVPTLAWGLALGYLRERSGSLLVPTICHGVPQGIAWAILGR